MYFPAGTATGNADAVRQGTVAQFFNTVGNLLAGADDQFVMEPGTANNGLLGPTPTLGADVGVGVNGEVFIRGRTVDQNGNQTVQAQAVLSPVVLIGLAVVAYLLLKK